MPLLSEAQIRNRTDRARTALVAWSARLESVSYHGVLARGYVVVRDRAGHVVTGANDARTSRTMEIEFCNGRVDVVLDAPAKAKRPPARQESLI